MEKYCNNREKAWVALLVLAPLSLPWTLAWLVSSVLASCRASSLQRKQTLRIKSHRMFFYKILLSLLTDPSASAASSQTPSSAPAEAPREVVAVFHLVVAAVAPLGPIQQIPSVHLPHFAPGVSPPPAGP